MASSSKPSAGLPSPVVSESGPPGAFLVELLIYHGAPFKNHWSYFVRSHNNPNLGVLMQAAGDVMNGFELEIERGHDLDATESNIPMERIPLQWVRQDFFVEDAIMFNFGVNKIDQTPVCDFEASATKIKVPEKSLRSAEDNLKVATAPRRVIQRNCQTWIVESADQLVRDRIFDPEVAAYLRSIEQ